MEGVEDIPGTVLAEGIDFAWESFPEYLDVLERGPTPSTSAPRSRTRAARLRHGRAGRRPRGAGHPRRDRRDGPARGRGRRGRRARLHDLAHPQPPRRDRRAHAQPDRRARPSSSASPRPGRRRPRRAAGRQRLLEPTRVRALLRRWPRSPAGRSRSRSPRSTRARALARALGQVDAAKPTADDPGPGGAPRHRGAVRPRRARSTRSSATPAMPASPAAPWPSGSASCATRGPRPHRWPRRAAPAAASRRADRTFELGDPPDYEPAPAQRRRPAAARAGVRTRELGLRPALADDGHALLYPVPELPDGDLEAVRRDARRPGHDPGPERRRRPRRHDLRRQLPDLPAHPLGARPRRRPPRRSSTWCSPVPRHRPRGRPGRPRRAGPRLPGRPQRRRPRPAAARTARDAHDLPAGGRRLVQRAEGYRHTFVAGQPRPTPTARRPARSPAGSCAAPSPPPRPDRSGQPVGVATPRATAVDAVARPGRGRLRRAGRGRGRPVRLPDPQPGPRRLLRPA